jgi:hypothetical protein
MDSAQTTKVDLLPVLASIGALLSVLVFVALLVGPKTVLNTIFNVSPCSFFSSSSYIISEMF